MGRRNDLKSILLIGSGPIIIGWPVVITLVRRHVKRFEKKAIVLFWLTRIPQQL